MKKVFGVLLVLVVSMFLLASCASRGGPCTGKFVAVPPVVAAEPAPKAVPAPVVVAPAPVVKAAPAPIVIYFDFDKSNIRASEQSKIDQAVKILKDDPTAVVKLAGHTDPIGTPAYNLKLSERRANAVKATLLAKGVDAKRISSSAYGETKLVKPDLKGIAANAVNRRTVVVIEIK